MKHTYFRYVNRSSVHDIKSIVIALMVFGAKRFGPMAGTLAMLSTYFELFDRADGCPRNPAFIFLSTSSDSQRIPQLAYLWLPRRP